MFVDLVRCGPACGSSIKMMLLPAARVKDLISRPVMAVFQLYRSA